MRVLHVVTSGELGGAQVHVETVVRALVSEGIDVEVACGPGSFLPQALSDVAPVHLIPWLRSPPAPLDDARSFAALMRLTRGRDVVHTHSAKAGALGRIAARLSGVRRIFHTSHGSFLGEERSVLTRAVLLAVERVAAASTTRLFVLSRGDLELMRSHGLYRDTPVELVRVAPERVAHPRGTWSYLGDRKSVVAVSNHYANKGLDVLLRAFAEVRRTVPGATLKLVGDGPLRAELERLAQELGAPVEFTGRLSDPTSAMLDAGVFVLPSRKEGLPIALLEAMALGVPTVASRVGGIPELVGQGEAALVPAGDVPALARAIEAVLGDPGHARELSSGARRAAARYVASASIAPVVAAYTPA